MRSILIHTIGNRDLQFSNMVRGDGNFDKDYLEQNKEKGKENFLVIKKGIRNSKHTFNKNSELILRQLENSSYAEDLRENLRFPLLESAIQFVRSQLTYPIDQVLVCTTYQMPAHPFDTFFVGKIVEKYLGSRVKTGSFHTVKRHVMNIAPVGNLRAKIVKECEQLLEEVKGNNYQKIFISNTAGLPALSEALNLVGFFQGYNYLGIDANKGAFVVDKKDQEEVVFNLAKKKLIGVINNTKI